MEKNQVAFYKERVDKTDRALTRYIVDYLGLDKEDENMLFNRIYDHIDAVRHDAYADGVNDTMELLDREVQHLQQLHKLASEMVTRGERDA